MRRLTTLAAAGMLGLAGVTGAAVVGAAVAPASAATEQSEPTDGRSWLADRVERIKGALAGLVGDGTITQDQADAVAETLADSDALGPHGPGRHMMRDGQTLADVAESRGVDVQELADALVAEATERIEAAVADGRISRERADEILADLPDRIAQRVEQGMPMHGDV